MSASVVLSIHSVHARNIYSGTKRFEFRTRKPLLDIDFLALYETGKVGAITGFVRVLEVIEGTPEQVWELTKKGAGISYEFFMSYFAGKARAVAYRLGEVYAFVQGIDLRELGVLRPPQSFQYIDTDVARQLIGANEHVVTACSRDSSG